MCLILLAWRQLPGFPVLIAANRDEFHQRPALAARTWPEHPDLIAGRDLQAGGTWLGVTRAGRFAGVTNYRDPGAPTGDWSRGRLCMDFLAGTQPAPEYLGALRPHRHRFSGFNLLLGDRDRAWYYSNREDRITELEPGFYGLSNGLLDSPWPKVTDGVDALRDFLQPHRLQRAPAAGELFHLLADSQAAEDHRLPDTGMGLAAERLLAPRFIISPDYGTRASTIIMAGHHTELLERSFDATARCTGERHFRLMPGAASPA